MKVPPVSNPYEASERAAGAPEGPLARVPKPPRVPSPAAEALLKDLDARDKRSLVVGCFPLAFGTLQIPLALFVQGGPPVGAVLVVGALFIVVGVLMVTSAYGCLRDRRPTFATGTPTVGTVTALAQMRGPATLLWTFTDEGGATLTGSLTAKRALLGESPLSVGSHIVVLYDPANPKRSLVWLD
jgi:hypothetical protein